MDDNAITKKEVLTILRWIEAVVSNADFVSYKPSDSRDFYHEVSDESRYDIDMPPQLVIGRLTDDIEFLKEDIRRGELSAPYTLTHALQLIRELLAGIAGASSFEPSRPPKPNTGEEK